MGGTGVDEVMTGTKHERHMRAAIALARRTSIEEQAGGPFGCVVVRDGEVIGQGANRVIAENDPTWHAEMAAIRDACRAIGTRDLSGCTVYASGEPCPMCYAAAWWARVDGLYYASTVDDAMQFGDFDDAPICNALVLPVAQRPLVGKPLLRKEMLEVWRAFQDMPDQIRY